LDRSRRYYTTTPSPHHPIGAKGVGELPNAGGVSASDFPSGIGNLIRFLPVDLPMFKQSGAICARLLVSLRRIRLRTLLSNLIRDDSGVTAIEYALIAALIAVAAIAAFTLVGTNLSTTFSTIAAKL
jgi:pilus assembly protein Flp/PilA